jgi:hypothetical protein
MLQFPLEVLTLLDLNGFWKFRVCVSHSLVPTLHIVANRLLSAFGRRERRLREPLRKKKKKKKVEKIEKKFE